MAKINYSFNLTVDVKKIDDLIKNFLSINKFGVSRDNTGLYYYLGDSISGYKYFSYQINGNTLNVYVWLEDESISINSSMESSVISYKNLLNSLFKEIENLNKGNSSNTSNQGISDNFKINNIKKQEKLCLISLVLSFVGLVLSPLGSLILIIPYLLNIYFASKCFKIPKKFMAYISIVLSILSIVVTFVSILIKIGSNYAA